MSLTPKDPTLEGLDWLDAWGDLFELMCDTFTHSKPSARALQIYAERLGDLPIATLRVAVEQCLATCRFFPTIADLREAAGLVAEDAYETPIEAWEEVRAYLEERARGGFYLWRNPLAERVATAMGLYSLQRSENTVTDRAHFLQAYREALSKERARTELVPAARAELPAPERLRLEAGPDAQGANAMQAFRCDRCGAAGRLPKTVDLATFACPGCALKAKQDAERERMKARWDQERAARVAKGDFGPMVGTPRGDA